MRARAATPAAEVARTRTGLGSKPRRPGSLHYKRAGLMVPQPMQLRSLGELGRLRGAVEEGATSVEEEGRETTEEPEKQECALELGQQAVDGPISNTLAPGTWDMETGPGPPSRHLPSSAKPASLSLAPQCPPFVSAVTSAIDATSLIDELKILTIHTKMFKKKRIIRITTDENRIINHRVPLSPLAIHRPPIRVPGSSLAPLPTHNSSSSFFSMWRGRHPSSLLSASSFTCTRHALASSLSSTPNQLDPHVLSQTFSRIVFSTKQRPLIPPSPRPNVPRLLTPTFSPSTMQRRCWQLHAAHVDWWWWWWCQRAAAAKSTLKLQETWWELVFDKQVDLQQVGDDAGRRCGAMALRWR
ncbi:hypothetical protein CPB84DRAFT_1852807 [Gymnopilus junonius]|uniref:Uncharacterized protein n=1 Tax=Gymnopilus junonius TaxID=109634 RepID=A0A9P5N9S1_GYMJU|nr:hypothetical protein CPB84DRAFT_1852807 [Gymnopilus junonius]